MADLNDVKQAFDRFPANPFYSAQPAVEPRQRYLIAMTPRSGSTLLAQQLSTRCGLGHPGEFLNEGFIAHFQHLFPTPSLEDFERFLLASFTTSHGVFGFKSDWFRFRQAREIGYLPRIYERIDLAILLRRRDFLAQAVSLAISMQSGIWHDNDVWFTPPEQAYASLTYDPKMILQNVRGLMEQEYQWERFACESRIPILRLDYEDFVGGIDQTLRTIVSALGQDIDIAPSRSVGGALRPTPSSVNSTWRLRFLASHGGLIERCQAMRGALSVRDLIA